MIDEGLPVETAFDARRPGMPFHFKNNPPPLPSTAQMGDDPAEIHLGFDTTGGCFRAATPWKHHLKCEMEALFSCFLTTIRHLAHAHPPKTVRFKLH